MDRFRAAGHQVAVLTSNVRVSGVEDVVEPNVHRSLSAYWDWEAGRMSLPRTPGARLQVERSNLAALDAALRDNRPDVVSVWHILGLSLSLLNAVEHAGIPIVFTVANDSLIAAPLVDGWLRLWRHWPLFRPRRAWGIPTAAPTLTNCRVNFVSEATKRANVSNSRWFRPVDAPVIPPGIDLSDFPLTPAAARPWRWRILYVGRIDPAKGVSTLVRAFAMLPGAARLELLGGGNADYRRHVMALAARLGVADRIRLDRVPRQQLRERYRDADVVVFPSEWQEPFGLVPLEAMACGIPVVATGVGGSAEFLEDRTNCLLFPAGHAEALAATLHSLARDAGLRAHLAAGGARTASELTIDRYADRLLNLHQLASKAQFGGAR